MKKTLFILLCMAAALSACTVDTECRQDLRVNMGVTLIGDSLHWAGDSIGNQHVTINSTTGMLIWGVGRDSLLADSTTTLTTVYLPLRKDSDECAYVLEINGLQDTLHCRYTRSQTFVSLACGCAVFATLDSVWAGGTLVDSILSVNEAVSTSKETHLKVYYTYPQ